MSLVQPALRRPFTVLVLVVAVALGSLVAILQMPRDIFPTLGIPTIYVAQPFGGMDPAQMEGYQPSPRGSFLTLTSSRTLPAAHSRHR